MKFTYLVTVEVPDNDLMPTEIDDGDICEFYGNEKEEGTGGFSPATLAMIVMRERLNCDEHYGFDYSVEYEDYGAFLLRVWKQANS